MAFTKNTFTPISEHGSKNVPSLFSYATTDDIGTIEGANYFNDASEFLKTYDLIYVTANTDKIVDGTEDDPTPTAGPTTHHWLVVEVINGVVTILANTPIATP